jgi:cyclic dehypoxanthinyl futalosine synthase
MRDAILEKVRSGSRLTKEESAWCLSEDSDLWQLGRLAHEARCGLHPRERVTYQVDRNINYTNVCVTGCRFCAFSRPPGHPEGWALTVDEVLEKVSKTLAMDGTGILLQGGHNPEIPFSYYIDMLSAIKSRFPTIHIHAFSPPEIVAFSRFFNMSIEQILGRLIDAGLDSLPGGGAEILVEPTHGRITPRKCTGEQWIDVMRTCHRMGMKSTATMVIGFGETVEERLRHLLAIRDLQDETGGFTAFIPWTFQPANTQMESEIEPAGGIEYLRVQAAARLILDNIAHHQVSWVTQGLRLGSVALRFGADDFSSVMMEERVVASAGAGARTNVEEMCAIIRAAGFEPVKRLTLYQNIVHG